jgi:LL-diaminopimelate aminotransferase
MIERNPTFIGLYGNYLFPEIERKVAAFRKKNPEAALISLGVGDTTQPIELHVAEAMAKSSLELSCPTSYRGYGPAQGLLELREAIAEKIYSGAVSRDAIFISDGAKCDVARLQMLFGREIKIAVQDPSYPVYVDTAVITGQGGSWNSESQSYSHITYLSCSPENDFFPDLEQLTQRVDVIYFCSPNNPTGAVASYEQLKRLVDYALANEVLLVFDAAYNAFTKEKNLHTIYQVPRADEVAIELGSFSKFAGFTGVRLGWSIVPEKLLYRCGSSIQTDWRRLLSTTFNGASLISQQGGIALLQSRNSFLETVAVAYYKENSAILRRAVETAGLKAYGGENSPYLWVAFPGRSSWDVFDALLEKAHLIVTPGSGFGPAGEGYIRLSAFGTRDDVLVAAERLAKTI